MNKGYNYKNLIKTIAFTDFQLRYEGSVLGYLWSLMKPLLLFGILYVVFTKVFKLGNSVPYYPVYLLSGIVLWSFFTEATGTCMGSIVGKRDIIRKVYFPRIVLPISNSLTSILILLANLAIVIVFMIANRIMPTWRLVFVPLLLLELYFFVLGIGLLLASLFVKFRDVSHIWEVVLQALFYGVPIIYTLAQLPLWAARIESLNPLAQIIQDFRWSVVTSKTVTASQILHFPLALIPYILPLFVFGIGLWVFEKMAVKFAEEV